MLDAERAVLELEEAVQRRAAEQVLGSEAAPALSVELQVARVAEV